MVFGNKSKETENQSQKSSDINQKNAENTQLNKDSTKNTQKEEPKEQTEKEKYENQINDLTLTLQRLQAEFENSQKRSQKQNLEYREYATANLIEQLLPVLDTLEQGIKHNKEFAIVHEQLSLILKKNGLEKIRVEEGNEFDHDKMDCLMQEENEKIKEGKVVRVLLTGYMLNNKILRLTKVSVSSGKKEQEKNEKIEQNETNQNLNEEKK